MLESDDQNGALESSDCSGKGVVERPYLAKASRKQLKTLKVRDLGAKKVLIDERDAKGASL